MSSPGFPRDDHRAGTAAAEDAFAGTQIKPGLHGPLKCLGGGYDANVISRLVNQSDFAGPDRIVDPGAGWLALGRGSHWSADVLSPRVASGCRWSAQIAGGPEDGRPALNAYRNGRKIKKKRRQVKTGA